MVAQLSLNNSWLSKWSLVLVSLTSSLFCSAWLLSTHILHRGIYDAIGDTTAGEVAVFLFIIGAFPAFFVALALSIYCLLDAVRKHSSHLGAAALPLLVAIFTAVVVFMAPLGRILDRRDFDLHYAALMEVVESVERGELWNGSPYIVTVSLSRKYPLSLSSVGGHRGIIVFREGDALYVVFGLFSGVAEDSAFVYRSDGEPPSLENPNLHNALSYEPLADRWYRVVFKKSILPGT